MKNEAQIISLDDFRLQMNELTEIQSSLLIQLPTDHQPSLYNIQQFPISISQLAPWFYFSLQAITFIITIDVYFQTFSLNFNTNNSFPLSLASMLINNHIFGYIINLLLIIIVLNSIFMHNCSLNTGFFWLLCYVGTRVYPYVRYFIELTLVLSCYFALDGDALSVIIFSLAILLSLISTFILQNFTLRKDQFCCKSLQFSLIFRISLILCLSLNIVCYSSITLSSHFLTICIFHTCFSTFVSICYFWFGLSIYRHKIPRHMTAFLVIIYLSLSVAMLFDVINGMNTSPSSSQIYFIFPITLGIFSFFCLSHLSKIRRQANSPDNKRLGDNIYFFFNKYQNADMDQQQDGQIRGIMLHHFIKGCNNIQCAANLQYMYDSKKKKQISIHKIGQYKVSLIKFYVKCLFQKKMIEHPNDINLKLDYIQFYYLKMKNVFIVMKLIAEIERLYLTPFQKLRLVRLKRVLKEESNGFSKQLYLKVLNIETILEAQQRFKLIQKSSEIVLRRNQLFWKYISRNQVNLSDILQIIKPNFKLIDVINRQWNKLSIHFDINRRWKFYYICFTVYIKNQKLLPAAIQDFGNSIEYESIFRTGNYFIDKTTQKQSLYNPIMMFQQNTCFVHTLCFDQKMIITKVSNFFTRNFDYLPSQVENAPLHMLMPPSIKRFHHEMFLDWVKEGRTNNQDFYSIKKIFPLTKRGYLLPCFKFYKQYLREEGVVQYIGMFKRNKQDELILLANQNFEIEAMTLGLCQKLKLGTGQYNYIRGLNVLSIMPMLVKYTKHSGSITEKDQDFLQGDENKNYFKKQSTLILKQKAGEGEEVNILHKRGIINLINVKIMIPNDLQQALQNYKQQVYLKKQCNFEAIRDSYLFMRKNRSFGKFRGDVCVHEREVLDKIYYQIQINQLQQNNRLQKIRLDQLHNESSKQLSMQNIQENRLTDIDLQLFFQVNKKKNKIVLFPSNNIFLKDQNNKALDEIQHITNIAISIRIIVVFFIALLFTQMSIQLYISADLKLLSSQLFWVTHHQKLQFMLNTQFNMQHLGIQDIAKQNEFFIVQYTHQVIQTLNTFDFQLLINDQTKNKPTLSYPYFRTGHYPNTILNNTDQPAYDSTAIFYKMYECLMSTHRQAELDPLNKLQLIQFHQFNNYLYSYYQKTDQIKSDLGLLIQSDIQMSCDLSLYLWITQGILLIGCFLFIFTRLLKVSNGFSQLLSIFIQMDNVDIKKIVKFTAYVRGLFENLNQKHNKMKIMSDTETHTLTNMRELDKSSSEVGFGQEQLLVSANTNLNKKIKKIQFGSEIRQIKLFALGLMLVFVLVIGGLLSSVGIYSQISINQYNTFQLIGIKLQSNVSVKNLILNSVIQKYRNASYYNRARLQPFINNMLKSASSGKDVQISSSSTQFSQIYKTIYFDDFCTVMSYVMDQDIAHQMSSVCSGDNIDKQVCAYLMANINTASFQKRCQNQQNGQAKKGIVNYNNYFNEKVILYLNDKATLTQQNIIEMNNIQKIIDIYKQLIRFKWRDYSFQLIDNRKTTLIILTIVMFALTLLLEVIFIQYLLTKNLKDNYQIFRRMHQNFIPQFVINKQKIIKAKLTKEGFMKE